MAKKNSVTLDVSNAVAEAITANLTKSEKAKARRAQAKAGMIAGYDMPVYPDEPEVENTVVVEQSHNESPVVMSVQDVDADPEPEIEVEIPVVDPTESMTPFEIVQYKITNGTIKNIFAYFPAIVNEDGSALRFTKLVDQDNVDITDAIDFTVNVKSTSSFYQLFQYRLPETMKTKGGVFSPKAFTDALKESYTNFANLLNSADVYSKRNFDRNPVILRVANGTFDNCVSNNEIVGTLLQYNELPHTKLIEMINDGEMANLIKSSVYTPSELRMYFEIKEELTDKTGVNIFGRIQNGSNGKIAFNFSSVIKDSTGKFEYLLPDVDETGRFNKTKERCRHLGWLENGVQKLVEAIARISEINYATILNDMDVPTFMRYMESAMTTLINAEKPIDAEKAESILSNLKVRNGINQYTTAMQVLNEAVMVSGTHGNAKYIVPILETALDLIFS